MPQQRIGRVQLRSDTKQEPPILGDIEVKHGVEFEIRSDGQFACLIVDGVYMLRMICRDHSPILVTDQRDSVRKR